MALEPVELPPACAVARAQWREEVRAWLEEVARDGRPGEHYLYDKMLPKVSMPRVSGVSVTRRRLNHRGERTPDTETVWLYATKEG